MKSIKILIVEDCIITAKRIKKSLLSFGYEVVNMVTSGEEAVSSCFTHKPDLILMDIEIEGEMNGIETADQIRLYFDIPIIYLTALSDEATLSRAKVAGGFAYLVKPFRTRDLYANIEMITYAHNMKKKAKENEIKYQNIFDNMFDGFAYYKVIFDKENKPIDYIFLEVNNGFEKLIGIKKDNIINKSIKELFIIHKHNDFFSDIEIFSEAAVDGKKIFIEEYYFNYAKKWFSITISSPQSGYLSTLMTDITERKESEEKLKFLTFYDSLTGLYNRAYFEEELKRFDTFRQLPLSVIMGDINGLKLANDVFGHSEGDKLLIRIAEKLKNACRSEDLIARWGGDEFVILLPKTDEKTANEICNRIMKACMEEDNSLINTSIALGSTTKNKPEEDISKLLIEAENRMYKNKLIESKKAHEIIINSLKNNLYSKTLETKEHIDNVKKMALLMAKYLGLSEIEIHELELLAEFHDIGKIAIPSEITKKRMPLTDEEKELVKQHPVTGYRIATASTRLMPIADAILFHHEWWNGAGYPLGIEKEEIPYIARLFSIVDTFDMMTRGGVCKEPVKTHAAIEEIKRCANIKFDPELVKVFVKVMEVKAAI